MSHSPLSPLTEKKSGIRTKHFLIFIGIVAVLWIIFAFLYLASSTYAKDKLEDGAQAYLSEASGQDPAYENASLVASQDDGNYTYVIMELTDGRHAFVCFETNWSSFGRYQPIAGRIPLVNDQQSSADIHTFVYKKDDMVIYSIFGPNKTDLEALNMYVYSSTNGQLLDSKQYDTAGKDYLLCTYRVRVHDETGIQIKTNIDDLIG